MNYFNQIFYNTNTLLRLQRLNNISLINKYMYKKVITNMIMSEKGSIMP